MSIPTLEEVVRAAGVSRATASRVVNRSPTVGIEARPSIARAIARLGYVPNRATRSLGTRRNDSIGVVIAEPTGRMFGGPFSPQVLRGISAGLAARQLQPVPVMSQSPEEERRAQRYLTRGHVDGVIPFSRHGDDPRLACRDALRAAGRTPDAGLEEGGGFTREDGQRSMTRPVPSRPSLLSRACTGRWK